MFIVAKFGQKISTFAPLKFYCIPLICYALFFYYPLYVLFNHLAMYYKFMKYFLPTCLFFLLFTQSSCADNDERTKKVQIYVATHKQIAIEEMYLMGIPASVKLAQAMLETNFGDSKLSQEAHNHFGIKCKDYWKGDTYTMDDDTIGECFRKYPSDYESYIDHSMFLRFHHTHRYDHLFSLARNDYKGWAEGLQKAGYATNPNYATIIIRLIETYDLHAFDVEGFLVGQPPKPIPNIWAEVPSTKIQAIISLNSHTLNNATNNNTVLTNIGIKTASMSPPTTTTIAAPDPTKNKAPTSATPNPNIAKPTFEPPINTTKTATNPPQPTQTIIKSSETTAPTPQSNISITDKEQENNMANILADIDTVGEQEENVGALIINEIEVNGCVGLVANRGLYPSYIAFRYQLPIEKVYEYNDLPRGITFHAGVPIFLQSKAKTVAPDKKIHIVQIGETLIDISQIYGVQVKTLCKFNNLTTTSKLKEGDFIYLQTQKPSQN